MKDKSSVLILTCDAYSNCWKGLGLKPSMDLRSDTEAPARTAQRSEGRRPVSAGRPAVLAVAHLAGSTLFGAERSFLTLLDGFSAIDFNVFVAAPPVKDPAYRAAILARCCVAYEMAIPWRFLGVAPDEACVEQLVEIIRRHGVTAVHVNTITPSAPLAAARRCGVPGAVHAREIPAYDPELCAALGGGAEEIVAAVLAEADYVIANSRTTALHYPTLGRTSVVPNVVDASAFQRVRRDYRGPVRVAIVSAGFVKKGISNFIDVARLLDGRCDAVFVIIGPKPSGIDSLEGDTPPLPKNLVIGGYCSTPEEAMAQADLVVNLSDVGESFGRTLLEAMACGLPVVAFDRGALRELVSDGENGFLVPHGNIDLVAERIATLCDSRALRRRMGEAGRVIAETRYTPGVFAWALRNSYCAIVPSTRSREQARGDMTISIPAQNFTRFKDPFYAKNRARFAHVTGVKLIDQHTLVCSTLLGQRMYLVHFDQRSGRNRIECEIHTRNRQGDVSTDLLDWDGGSRLLTSDCEAKSVSLYRLDGGRLAYEDTVSIDGPGAGFCHGVKFVPGMADIVCATTTTGDRYTYFLSLTTRRPVYRLGLGGWLPKDVAFIDARRLVICAMNQYIGPSPGGMIDGKIMLVELDGAWRSHKVIDEIPLAGVVLEGAHVSGNIAYFADQSADKIHTCRIDGDRLRPGETLEGFSFPHGVDVRGDLLAVANYGPSTVTLRKLRF